MQLELYGKLLVWAVVAELAFSAIAAATWIIRLDALGMYHDFGWAPAFLVIASLYSLPFVGGYFVCVLVLLFVPSSTRDKLAKRFNDKTSFLVAGLFGGLLGLIITLLLNIHQLGNSIDL